MQRFQILQLFKDCFTGSRENRAFHDNHLVCSFTIISYNFL